MTCLGVSIAYVCQSAVSRVLATGALEASKAIEVAFVKFKIKLTAWVVNYVTDQLMKPQFSGGST